MAQKRVVRRPRGRPRKRVRRVGMYVPRIRRAMKLPTYSLKRTFWLENWSPNSGSVSGFWKYYVFDLNALGWATELSNVFDLYKINACKFTFRPRYDNFAGNDTTDTTFPGITNTGGTHMHVIVDPYSQTTPTGVYNSGTLNSFFEQGNVRSYQGGRPFSVYYKPCIPQLTSSPSAATRRQKAPWLQLQTQRDILHTGFHVFAQDINLTGVFGQSWDVFVTVYMKLKGDR